MTEVIFYFEQDGTVLAYFPKEDYGDNLNKVCYAHIGQHGACSPEYVEGLAQCTKRSEIRELYNELFELGYELKILNKF